VVVLDMRFGTISLYSYLQCVFEVYHALSLPVDGARDIERVIRLDWTAMVGVRIRKAVREKGKESRPKSLIL
jgi:hypothetical protein